MYRIVLRLRKRRLATQAEADEIGLFRAPRTDAERLQQEWGRLNALEAAVKTNAAHNRERLALAEEEFRQKKVRHKQLKVELEGTQRQYQRSFRPSLQSKVDDLENETKKLGIEVDDAEDRIFDLKKKGDDLSKELGESAKAKRLITDELVTESHRGFTKHLVGASASLSALSGAVALLAFDRLATMEAGETFWIVMLGLLGIFLGLAFHALPFFGYFADWLGEKSHRSMRQQRPGAGQVRRRNESIQLTIIGIQLAAWLSAIIWLTVQTFR